MHKVRMTAKHLGQIILMRQDDGPGTPGEHAHNPENSRRIMSAYHDAS
jgi:hypothetical protein